MNTTLNAIRSHGPCADGWAKLLRHLGKTEADDEPLSLRVILDSNGFDDALWCLRAVPGCERKTRLYAIWCARQVQHLMTDPRSLAALDVAERHAIGEATDAELTAASDAARAAARDAADATWAARSAATAARAAATAAVDAARDAAWAARSAATAAVDAAVDAAWAARSAATAAVDAAWAAAWAAWSARDAADAAARDAARAAAWGAQRARFIEVFCGKEVQP